MQLVNYNSCEAMLQLCVRNTDENISNFGLFLTQSLKAFATLKASVHIYCNCIFRILRMFNPQFILGIFLKAYIRHFTFFLVISMFLYRFEMCTNVTAEVYLRSYLTPCINDCGTYGQCKLLRTNNYLYAACECKAGEHPKPFLTHVFSFIK